MKWMTLGNRPFSLQRWLNNELRVNLFFPQEKEKVFGEID